MSEVNEETLRAREALAGHYKEVLGLLGEDAGREGLLKTPERVAKAMQFLTKGYHEDPEAVLRSAMFQEEDYKQMVIVRDIDFYYGVEQDSPCRGYLRPPSPDTGAYDDADQGLYPEDLGPVGRDGRDRGAAYVHADAWRGETKFLDDYL